MTRGLHRAMRLLTGLAALLTVACIGASAQESTEKKEVYLLPWPADAEWHAQEEQGGNGTTLVEFLKGKETFENWTEIGSITRVAMRRQPGQTIPLENVIRGMFAENQKACPEAKLTILGKDSTARYPWIIYSVACPKYTNGKVESNVYQAIVGDEAIYMCQRGMKTPTISDEKVTELVGFFKGGRFAYE